MRMELRAKSSSIGCLSTVIVFRFQPASIAASPLPSSGGLPDRLGLGDASSGSSRPTGAPSHETTGHVAYVIRNVRVYFEDRLMAELRSTAPFRRPPRVSGKRATEQIEGLPLER